MSAAQAMPSTDSLEPIKRVKAVESEVAAKLADVEQRTKTDLEQLRQDVEGAVTRARAEAEALRDAKLRTAHADADREAAGIVAEGQTRADAIRPKGADALGKQRDAILSTILGAFRRSSDK